MKKILFLFCVAFTISLFSAPPVSFKKPATAWKEMKTSKFDVTRRSAYIYLTSLDSERQKAWIEGIKSSDPVIRKDAIFSYFQAKGDLAAAIIAKNLKKEKDPNVQDCLLSILRKIKSKEIRRKLSAKIVLTKSIAQNGELYKVNLRLKDNPTFDHEVETFKRLSLGKENWKIYADPKNTGVKNKIFAVNFNDSKWSKVKVDKNWEVQGLKDYNGFAWYRVKFTAPIKKEAVGAELYFPLVDEEAWVWLNGSYVGQRAEGQDAWNKPFYLDITNEILWGKENILTVRVFDSDKAGGICQEPQLHLLR